MLPLTLALATVTYQATPSQAALRIVIYGPTRPVVRRVNVVGRYATVLAGGGIEGETVTAPILLQRFSFGWQLLDLLNFRCRLQTHAFAKDVEAALMRGMPTPRDDRPCRGLKDAGAPAEVEAVRRLMRGPLIPYVVVAANWAMGEWYGAGGGESLYRLRDGNWHLVASGGGAMGVSYMSRYGVPRDDWCKFGIYDAKCH